MQVQRVEIEPYHALGEHKYPAVGREALTIAPMPKERVEAIVREVQAQTRVPVKRA